MVPVNRIGFILRVDGVLVQLSGAGLEISVQVQGHPETVTRDQEVEESFLRLYPRGTVGGHCGNLYSHCIAFTRSAIRWRGRPLRGLSEQ